MRAADRLVGALRRRLREPETRADLDRFEEHYGRFMTPAEVRAAPITGLAKESGWIHRFMVEFVDRLRGHAPVAPLLLAGEYRAVVGAYVEWLGLDPSQIVTTGLGDVDVVWDYERPPPEGLGTFSLILSQAMLEHLLDPFGHLRDLCSLLVEGGSVIVMTHTPGFPYHRYPVDCFRFYPDFFEVAADRLGMDVTGRLVGDDRIVYQLTRPALAEGAGPTSPRRDRTAG
jgi:hypothetical protein